MVLRSGHSLRAMKLPATETQPNLNQPTEIKTLQKLLNACVWVCGGVCVHVRALTRSKEAISFWAPHKFYLHPECHKNEALVSCISSPRDQRELPGPSRRAACCSLITALQFLSASSILPQSDRDGSTSLPPYPGSEPPPSRCSVAEDPRLPRAPASRTS